MSDVPASPPPSPKATQGKKVGAKGKATGSKQKGAKAPKKTQGKVKKPAKGKNKEPETESDVPSDVPSEPPSPSPSRSPSPPPSRSPSPPPSRSPSPPPSRSPSPPPKTKGKKTKKPAPVSVSPVSPISPLSSAPLSPVSPLPVPKTKKRKKPASPVDSEDEAPPAPKRRGRPKRKTGDTSTKPKSKSVAKPKPEEMTDVQHLFEEELPEDVSMRITFSQPQILKKVNNTIAELVKIAYFSVKLDPPCLCVDMQDDDCFSVLTLRLGCNILLNDELKEKLKSSDVYFALNTRDLDNCLKLIRNFQSCSFEQRTDDDIELVASEQEKSGNIISINMKNWDTGAYDPCGLAQTGYKWHINDIDIQELQNLITAATKFGNDLINFSIYEAEGSKDFFLVISVNDSSQQSPDVKVIQHIRQEENAPKEDDDEAEIDGDEEGIEVVYRASLVTDMSNDQICKFIRTKEPVYNKQFAVAHINKFLKNTEHKCVMTLHFTPDTVGEDGEEEERAMIIKYSVGDSSSLNYMKFAMAPNAPPA